MTTDNEATKRAEFKAQLAKHLNDKRDQFAAAAITGILANPAVVLTAENCDEIIDCAIKMSFGIANKMIRVGGNV